MMNILDPYFGLNILLSPQMDVMEEFEMYILPKAKWKTSSVIFISQILKGKWSADRSHSCAWNVGEETI